MITVSILLLIIAGVLFVLAALPVTIGKINLWYLGWALIVFAFVADRI